MTCFLSFFLRLSDTSFFFSCSVFGIIKSAKGIFFIADITNSYPFLSKFTTGLKKLTTLENIAVTLSPILLKNSPTFSAKSSYNGLTFSFKLSTAFIKTSFIF